MPSSASTRAALQEVRTSESFFDSLEERVDDISAFRKWQGALRRSSAETADAIDAGCHGHSGQNCPYHAWLQFLKYGQEMDRWEQLQAINNEINKRRYVADVVNYGEEDHWASIGEFLGHESGDCEDYAIAKFLSLRRLGWNDRDLRLVAVRDLQLRTGHAVLIAFHGGKAWLLDNLIRQVTDAADVHHYQPLYSVNESSWWRHQPRKWMDSADRNSTGGDAARH